MSANTKNYTFECLEKYHGGVNHVKKQIEVCDCCNNPLTISHLPDYRNLIIQETALCSHCGEGNRKVIHVLN